MDLAVVACGGEGVETAEAAGDGEDVEPTEAAGAGPTSDAAV